MTTPDTPVRPDLRGVLVELVGALLVLAGAVALTTAAFLVDLRLGLAVLGAISVLVGFALATSRTDEQ